MKKQENKTTKTNFLTEFKNTKIGVKVIIIGGILALVTTTIVVPIVVANKGDFSNPKPNVDNRKNDNNEDDKNEDDNNVDDNQQGKTDSYVQWHAAYTGGNVIVNNATQSEYDYINDQISTTEGIHFGNQVFLVDYWHNISFNQMSKIGIDKDEVLKNKANDKIVGTFIKFLGYDFKTSKTFANVFYYLKEDSAKSYYEAKWYYEIVEITGFGKPRISLTRDASIADKEFHNVVLPKDFIVSSDLYYIGKKAFEKASFAKDAKFSLAQTQVELIPQYAFSYAKLPNGFVLNSETNSIGSDAFSYATFDQEAKFSLAQTQVKSISYAAFASVKLPNAFALNDETTTIGENAFWSAYLNPGFKIPETIISIAQNSFLDAILPSGYGWYDKDGNKQKITATNYPYPGWYVGKI